MSLRRDACLSRRRSRSAGRMNYRHAFHAGNFADVIKHIVLMRILLYLQEKPAAFRVIDTHAGSRPATISPAMRRSAAANGAPALRG